MKQAAGTLQRLSAINNLPPLSSCCSHSETHEGFEGGEAPQRPDTPSPQPGPPPTSSPQPHPLTLAKSTSYILPQPHPSTPARSTPHILTHPFFTPSYSNQTPLLPSASPLVLPTCQRFGEMGKSSLQSHFQTDFS